MPTVEDHPRYTANDPFEDTERPVGRKAGKGDKMVTQPTIRSRILKDAERLRAIAKGRRYTANDPFEDTERCSPHASRGRSRALHSQRPFEDTESG